MSCSITPKLVSFYTNKVNIYDSDCFIKLPNYRTCPPPPCIYLAPQIVYPPTGPYDQPAVCPVPQPLNYPGAYCGIAIAPYNPVCAAPTNNYSSCGSPPEHTTTENNYQNPTYIPSGPGSSQPQITGCTSCGS